MPKRKSTRGGRGGRVAAKQAKSSVGKEGEASLVSEEIEIEAKQNVTEEKINEAEPYGDTAVNTDSTREKSPQKSGRDESTIQSCTQSKAVAGESHSGEDTASSTGIDQSSQENPTDASQHSLREEDVIAECKKSDDKERSHEEPIVKDVLMGTSSSKDDVMYESGSKKSEENQESAAVDEAVASKDNHGTTECDEIGSSESPVGDAELSSDNRADGVKENALATISVQEDILEDERTACVASDALETISVQDDTPDNEPTDAENTDTVVGDGLETVSVQEDSLEDDPLESAQAACIVEDGLDAVSAQEDNLDAAACITSDALETVSVQEDSLGDTECLGVDDLENVSGLEDNLDVELREGEATGYISGDGLDAVSVQEDNLDDVLMEAEVAKGGSDEEEIQYVDEEADEEQNLLDVISGNEKKNHDDKHTQDVNSKFEEISEGSINQAEQEEVLNESFSDVEIIGETFVPQKKKVYKKSEKQTQGKEAESLEEVFFATENDYSKVMAEDKDNDDISDDSLSDHENANMSLEEISDDDVDVSKKKKSCEPSKNESEEKSKQAAESGPTAQVENTTPEAKKSSLDESEDKKSEGKDTSKEESKRSSPSADTSMVAQATDKDGSSLFTSKDPENDAVYFTNICGSKKVEKEEASTPITKPSSRNLSKTSPGESQRGCSDLPQKKAMVNSACQTATHRMKGKIVQCSINPIKSMEALWKKNTSSKFLDQFREKLPFSIPGDIIADITSPQTNQDSYYSLGVGPITFADMASTLFRDNLMTKSDKFSLTFDENHHGIYRALLKSGDSVAAFVRQLKTLELGNRYITLSLSYGVEKVTNGVVSLMFDQDIQTRKQHHGRGDGKLRAKLQLRNVPDGVSKDFVHLLFPEALSITSGPQFDNKRSIFLGFSSQALAQEMLLHHDLVVISGHQVSISASDYVECSTSIDSLCSVKDGSVVIDVASESSEDVLVACEAVAEPMAVADSSITPTNDAGDIQPGGDDGGDSELQLKQKEILCEAQSGASNGVISTRMEGETKPDTQQHPETAHNSGDNQGTTDGSSTRADVDATPISQEAVKPMEVDAQQPSGEAQEEPKVTVGDKELSVGNEENKEHTAGRDEGRLVDSLDTVASRQNKQEEGRLVDSLDTVASRQNKQEEGRLVDSLDTVASRQNKQEEGRLVDSLDTVASRQNNQEEGRLVDSLDTVASRQNKQEEGDSPRLDQSMGEQSVCEAQAAVVNTAFSSSETPAVGDDTTSCSSEAKPTTDIISDPCDVEATSVDNILSSSKAKETSDIIISDSSEEKITSVEAKAGTSEAKETSDGITSGPSEGKATSDVVTLCISEATATCEDITLVTGSLEAKVTEDKEEARGTDAVTLDSRETKLCDDSVIPDTATSMPKVSRQTGETDKDPEQPVLKESAETERLKEELPDRNPVANKSLEDVSDEEMTQQDRDVVILREDASTTVLAKIDLTLEESTGSDAEVRSNKSGTSDTGKTAGLDESEERLLMTDAGFEIDMEVIDVIDEEASGDKVMYARRERETSRSLRERSRGASSGGAAHRVSGKYESGRSPPGRGSTSGQRELSNQRSGPYRLVPSRESTAQRRDSYHQYSRRRSRSPTSSYRDNNWHRESYPHPPRQSVYPSGPDRSQYSSTRPAYVYRPPYTGPSCDAPHPPAPYYSDLSRPPSSYPRAPVGEPDRRAGYPYTQQQSQPPRRGGRPEASPPWREIRYSRGREFQVPHSQSQVEKRRASPPPAQHRSRSHSLSDMSPDSDYGEPPAKKPNKRVRGREVSRKVSRSPISISSQSRSLSPVSGSPSPDRNLLRNEIVKSVKQFLHVAREIQQVKENPKTSHRGSPVRRVSSSKRSPPQRVSSSPRRRVLHTSSSKPKPAAPASSHRPRSRSPPAHSSSRRPQSPAHHSWGAGSSRQHSRSPKRVRKSSYRHRSPSPVSSESSGGSPLPPPPSGRIREYRQQPPSSSSTRYRDIPQQTSSSSRQAYRGSPKSKRSRDVPPSVVGSQSHRGGGAERRREEDETFKRARPTWSEQQREKLAAAAAEAHKQRQQAEMAAPISVPPAPTYVHPTSSPAYPYSSPYMPGASVPHPGYPSYPPGLAQTGSTSGPYQPQQYTASSGYHQPYMAPAAYPPPPSQPNPHMTDAYEQAFSIIKTALGELQQQPHHQQQQQQQQPYPSHSYSRMPSSSQPAPAASAQNKSWSMGSNAMVFQRILGNEGESRKKSGSIELLSDRGRHERPKVAKGVRVLTSVPTKKK